MARPRASPIRYGKTMSIDGAELLGRKAPDDLYRRLAKPIRKLVPDPPHKHGCSTTGSRKGQDLVVGGYGDNSVAPAMPLIVERNRYLVAMMALAVNASFDYANYFVMIPTGPRPNEALTEGFFELAVQAIPKPPVGDGDTCCGCTIFQRSGTRRQGAWRINMAWRLYRTLQISALGDGLCSIYSRP